MPRDVALAGHAAQAPALLRGQEGPTLLPPYVADVDGSGTINASDREIVSTALYAQRGFGLTPRPGFDYRADVFGRAVVEPLVVDSVTHTIQRYGESTMPTSRRPITIAWHYGWYNTLDRPPGSQTVRFKGGNYLSADPEVETTFHDLKNEFGVTVDALSWIPRRLTTGNNRNYFRGFLQAPNVATRHVCLLYEDTLVLPTTGGRISFLAPTVQSSFRDDFVAMARFLKDVLRVSPARIFALDGRPVVFIFGTHTWGQLPLSPNEASAMQTTIAGARQDFADVYGEFPYLVGEEIQLSSTGQFSATVARAAISSTPFTSITTQPTSSRAASSGCGCRPCTSRTRSTPSAPRMPRPRKSATVSPAAISWSSPIWLPASPNRAIRPWRSGAASTPIS